MAAAPADGAGMVKLNKIYTRTGDDGRTGLATGERLAKHHPRVEAYGAVDETNAAIGLARCALSDDAELDAILARIQNDLFDLGADLATPGPDDALEFEPLRIIESQWTRLEREIDALNADIPPLDSFVLPGGSEAAARLHAARTICRRAERRGYAFAAETDSNGAGAVNPHALTYLNRLSDLLFVAARRANANGAGDVKWTPGENR